MRVLDLAEEVRGFQEAVLLKGLKMKRIWCLFQPSKNANETAPVSNLAEPISIKYQSILESS